MLEPRTTNYRIIPGLQVESGKDKQLPYRPFQPASGDRLMQLSSRHRRSFEDARIANQVIWEDQYGNLFGSVNYKGVPFREAGLQFDQYATHGLRVHGLKDRFSTDRVDLASEIMRQAGLGTERVTEKTSVDTVLFQGQRISVEEWKRYYLTHTPELRNDEGHIVNMPRETIDKYVEDVEFEVAKRDLQVGERVYDIMDAAATNAGKILALGNEKLYIPRINRVVRVGDYYDNEDRIVEDILETYKQQTDRTYLFDSPRWVERARQSLARDYSSSVNGLMFNPDYTGVITSSCYLNDVLDSILPWLNVANGIAAKKGKAPAWENFDVKDESTIITYLASFLPKSMGNYLGRLQGIELTIGFATPHNWSAAATMYDLDSTEGRPLGDKEPSIDRTARDIHNSLETVIDLLGVKPVSQVSFEGKSYPHYNLFVQTFGAGIYSMIDRAVEGFNGSFIQAYNSLTTDGNAQLLRRRIAEAYSEFYKESTVDYAEKVQLSTGLGFLIR